MEKRRMTCINCPMGCSLEVIIDGDIINVTGNTCKRGEEYAINEVKDPKRVVTSTVRVMNGDKPLAAVKTNGEIPKKYIFDIMRIINTTIAYAPVKIGDVIIKNVLNTSVDITAASNVDKRL